MMRVLLVAIVLAFSPSAWAQPFNQFVEGLPSASVLGGADLLYVLQGGISKNTTAAALAASFPSLSFANPTASIGLVPINGSASTAMRSDAAPAINTAITPTWSGLHTFGAGLVASNVSGGLPWVQAFSYAAGSTGSKILSVRGTALVPNTDGVATGIFQSTVNFADVAPALYASTIKQGLNGAMTLAYGIAVWGEAVDAAGGGSISGGRFNANCVGGTGGNCTGATNVGLCSVSFAYCIGAENQAWNLVADATISFNPLTFSTGVLSSCASASGAGKKCDGGFIINPEGTLPVIYGLLAPSGTIDSTGSVVASLGTSAHGINFNTANCTTDCWLGPSGTSLIDASGNITSSAVVRANTGFNTNGVAGLASKVCTINTANAATGVTITISGGIITGTTTC